MPIFPPDVFLEDMVACCNKNSNKFRYIFEENIWDMAIKCLYYLVPETGIEPVRPFGRGILSPKKEPRLSRVFLKTCRKLAILGSVPDCIKLHVFHFHPGMIPA